MILPIISILVIVLAGYSSSFEKQQYIPRITEAFIYDGVSIHYKDMGAGRPIVFLHGYAASLDTWRLMEDALRTKYRLVLVDLKGHGYSARPHDSKYSIEDHAEIVIGLINHLALENVVLVGHSFGAGIALVAALEANKTSPEIVSSLVLIGATFNLDDLPLALRLLGTPVIGWLAMKLTSASFRTRLILEQAYYDDEKVTAPLIEMYARYQNIPRTDYALLKTAAQFITTNFPEVKKGLNDLHIPVLNILGEHDEIINRSSAEEVCRLLLSCKFVTIENVGHIPQEEAPDNLLALLRDFLDGN
ncbi:MAG: alpha/beta fold hydrolase [Candidatus Binatia bacterium]